uniref:C-type lectin domain-containing protein n=1 Tax=Astyanax mexicanus TaxID=7994 RepID=A0A8B9H7S2_ASTMX
LASSSSIMSTNNKLFFLTVQTSYVPGLSSTNLVMSSMLHGRNGGNKSRYIFVNKQKTWHEAQSYCREHHTDLASVRNWWENRKIKAGNDDNFWIGLFKDTNDWWEWSDQSSSSFRYWNSNQPDQSKCAAASVKDQGQWHDIECDEQRPFICHESELYLMYSILY